MGNLDLISTFIQSHRESLVVVKFYAAYCQACRSLEPRFLEVMNDPQLQNLPVVWAEFQASRHTKELFRRLGVLTLPTIHFYDGSMLDDDDVVAAGAGDGAGGGNGGSSSTAAAAPPRLMLPAMGHSSNLIENFPCPPAKVKLLKKKLARFLNQRVDPKTFQLRRDDSITTFSTSTTMAGDNNDEDDESSGETETTTTATNGIMSATTTATTTAPALPTASSSSSSAQPPLPPQHQSSGDAPRQRRKIVIDNELITDDHIDYLRYGMPFFADLTDEEFDAMLDRARLLTFDVGDVICKQGMPGTTFYVLKRGSVEMSIKSRFEDPIRTPPHYLGVVVGELGKGDYFGERALSTGEPLAASFRVVEKVRVFAFDVEDIPESSILSKQRRATQEMIQQLDQRYVLPADYQPTTLQHNQYMMSEADHRILELLVRFKQIRQAAKCFNYIMMTEPKWNDPGRCWE